MPADRDPLVMPTPAELSQWREQENQRTGLFNGFKVDENGNYRWQAPVQMDPRLQQRIDYAKDFYDPKTGKYLGDPSKMPLAAKLILGGTLGVAGGFALAPLLAGGAGASAAAPSVGAVGSGVPTAALGTAIPVSSIGPAAAAASGIGFAGVPGLSYGALGSTTPAASGGGFAGAGSGLAGSASTAASTGGSMTGGWGALAKGIGMDFAKAVPSMVAGRFTGNAGKDLQRTQADQLKFQLEQMMKQQPARDALIRGLMGRLPTHMKQFMPQYGAMQAPLYPNRQLQNPWGQ